jgi:hypothetical protein
LTISAKTRLRVRVRMRAQSELAHLDRLDEVILKRVAECRDVLLAEIDQFQFLQCVVCMHHFADQFEDSFALHIDNRNACKEFVILQRKNLCVKRKTDFRTSVNACTTKRSVCVCARVRACSNKRTWTV